MQQRGRQQPWVLCVVWTLFLSAQSSVMACELCDGTGCPYCRQPSTTVGTAQLAGAPIGGDAFNDMYPGSTSGTPVSSFVVQGGKWPQNGLGEPVTITYSYNNMFDGGLRDPDGESLPADVIRGSIEEALSLWASVAPLHFVEVVDEGGPVVQGNYPDGQFGQIRFQHRYINGPDIPGGQPTAKAQAWFPGGSGNHPGDVYFDNGDPWRERGELAIPDLLGAAIHELGHSLGLGHSSVADANMYWIFTRYPNLGSGGLHPDDIAGIQAIYGSGIGSISPLGLIPEPGTWTLALIAAMRPFARLRRKNLTFGTKSGFE